MSVNQHSMILPLLIILLAFFFLEKYDKRVDILSSLKKMFNLSPSGSSETPSPTVLAKLKPYPTELSNYFISMAKNNKIENKQNTTLSEFINKHKEKPVKELAVLLNKKFPKSSKKDLADALDISRTTLYKYLK